MVSHCGTKRNTVITVLKRWLSTSWLEFCYKPMSFNDWTGYYWKEDKAYSFRFHILKMIQRKIWKSADHVFSSCSPFSSRSQVASRTYLQFHCMGRVLRLNSPDQLEVLLTLGHPWTRSLLPRLTRVYTHQKTARALAAGHPSRGKQPGQSGWLAYLAQRCCIYECQSEHQGLDC